MFSAISLGQSWWRLGEMCVAMVGTLAEGRKPQDFQGVAEQVWCGNMKNKVGWVKGEELEDKKKLGAGQKLEMGGWVQWCSNSQNDTVKTAKEEETWERSCLNEMGSWWTRTSDDLLIHLSISCKRFCGPKYFSPAKESIPCGVMQWHPMKSLFFQMLRFYNLGKYKNPKFKKIHMEKVV